MRSKHRLGFALALCSFVVAAHTASGQSEVVQPWLLAPVNLQPEAYAFTLQDGSLLAHEGGATLLSQPSPSWTPFVPIASDPRPSLQSAPALAALPDGTAFAVWMDSRNALPDVYGTRWSNNPTPVPIPTSSASVHSEVRVGHRHPHFAAPGLRHAAVVGEQGRVFVAWADEAQIYVVRGDLNAGTWTSPTTVVNVSQWEAIANQPKLATNGSGELVLVWTDFRQADGRVRVGDIYATRCDGNTTPITCNSQAVRLNDDIGAAHAQRMPAISQRGKHVVVVWEDGREAGVNYPRVYAAISTDGGQTWSPNQRVNKRLDGNAPGPRDAATRPAVTHADDGSVWVAWEHRTGSPSAAPDIYVARWDGSQWSTPWRVDQALPRVRSVAPTIAATGNTVVVAWQDHRGGHARPRIFTARWNGNAWTESALPSYGLTGAQRAPALSAANGTIYLVWENDDNGQTDVYGSFWMGGGWAAPVLLNTHAARLPYQLSPALASANGRIYALFADRRDTYIQIHFAEQQAGTHAHWETRPALPTGAEKGVSVAPERMNLVADADGRLHALWSDGQWPRGWRVRHSVLSGTAWTDPVFLSRQITSNESLPSLAAHGNTLVASWSRWHRLEDGQVHVQLYASWNTGTGWVTETAILTKTFSAWNWPTSVATDGSFLYVAWHREDANNGRGRILLARRPLDLAASWDYRQINPPHADDWCYHRHPRLAVGTDGTLHAVWVGCARRRENASWPRDYYVFYAQSSDRGETWTQPLRVHLISPDLYFDAPPALTIAPDGRIMLVYPIRLNGTDREFAAALVRNGSVEFTHTLTTNAAWVPAGRYEHVWYGGDGAGSVAYDPIFDRFVVAIVERSNGRAPRIQTTAYTSFQPRVFVPLILRQR